MAKCKFNSWQTKKLGEVCDLQNGFAFKSKDYINQSNTLNFRMSNIRPGGFVNIYHNQRFLPDSYALKYKDFLLKNGDLVIAMTDMATETKILGVPTIIETDGKNLLLNQRVGRLFDLQVDKVYVPFLKYVLSSKQVNDYYKSLGRGGLQINIGKQDILNVQIPLPSISEQKRIVSLLDELFEKLEKTKKNAEKNLKNAKELFESYFCNVFGSPGINWESKKLEKVCDFFNGKAHEKSIDKNGDYIVVNSKFISSNGQIYKKTKKQFFPLLVGDVVMVMSDVPNGKALMKGYLVDVDNLYTLNQRICVIRSKRFDNKFLYYQLNRNKYFLAFDNGENQTNLRKNDILNCPLFIPPLSEQKNIVAKLDTLSAQTQSLASIYQQKLTNFEELKKSILQKAFQGEL